MPLYCSLAVLEVGYIGAPTMCFVSWRVDDADTASDFVKRTNRQRDPLWKARGGSNDSFGSMFSWSDIALIAKLQEGIGQREVLFRKRGCTLEPNNWYQVTGHL
jgi:hypothetical protein